MNFSLLFIHSIRFFLFLFFFHNSFVLFGQKFNYGISDIDDFNRRKNLIDSILTDSDFMLRKVNFFYENPSVSDSSLLITKKKCCKFSLELTPIFFSNKFDGSRPSWTNEFGFIPSRGVQSSLMSGFFGSFLFFHFQIHPEFSFAQNLDYVGFSNFFSSKVVSDRFIYWNISDTPERIGGKNSLNLTFGQSFFSIRLKKVEFGVGTRNYWWGPGQWNSLIFSNNARGFPHVSLNSYEPIPTFMGHFNFQILIGRLEASKSFGSQIKSLNDRFFRPLDLNWRYFNGGMLIFSPKWVPSLSLGYSRTFQYYNYDRPKGLTGLLPIFEPMAKENLFSNGNSLVYDLRNQSQQIAIFGRYKFVEGKAEIYFQFGRRDHALNWREFFLNPEHARAYQIGFLKLTDLKSLTRKLQIKGEITHQQESINRLIRYGQSGGLTWHTHGKLRGFTNFGEPMGVGIGTGSNIQSLELAFVKDWKKTGILFERLENNKDFYHRAFGYPEERLPWIDWSATLLWSTSYKKIFLSTRLQGIYARNYQWGLSEISTPEFPVSNNSLSFHSQVNLIYFWNRELNKN